MNGWISTGLRLWNAEHESGKLWADYQRIGGSIDPEPDHKVFSTMAARQVRALLMGGQARVLYGAAEFSRDTDLLILAETENLERLNAALRDLQAECIAVAPFNVDFCIVAMLSIFTATIRKPPICVLM